MVYKIWGIESRSNAKVELAKALVKEQEFSGETIPEPIKYGLVLTKSGSGTPYCLKYEK